MMTDFRFPSPENYVKALIQEVWKWPRITELPWDFSGDQIFQSEISENCAHWWNLLVHLTPLLSVMWSIISFRSTENTIFQRESFRWLRGVLGGFWFWPESHNSWLIFIRWCLSAEGHPVNKDSTWWAPVLPLSMLSGLRCFTKCYINQDL